MDILISIDDTDNADTPGTGHLAARVAQLIAARGWGRASYITRHQLYVHPDIPYTSHNSAMCFAAAIDSGGYATLIAEAASLIVEYSAPGSDPGLCVVARAALTDGAALVDFGRRAKQAVLRKDDAYALARRLDVHLSEHGGSGQGVIGALAGAGLRLCGDDGRVRGGQLPPPGKTRLSVAALRELPEIDAVHTRDGVALPDDSEIVLGEKIKTVMIGGLSTLLVTAQDADGTTFWRACDKQELRAY